MKKSLRLSVRSGKRGESVVLREQIEVLGGLNEPGQ